MVWGWVGSLQDAVWNKKSKKRSRNIRWLCVDLVLPDIKCLCESVTSGRQNNGPPRCAHPVNQLPFVANGVLQKWLHLYSHQEIILNYPDMPNLTTWILGSREPFLAKVAQRDAKSGGLHLLFSEWTGGKEQEPRDTVSLQSWKMQGYRSFPKVSRKAHSPAGTVILAQWHHVGLLCSAVR